MTCESCVAHDLKVQFAHTHSHKSQFAEVEYILYILQMQLQHPAQFAGTQSEKSRTRKLILYTPLWIVGRFLLLLYYYYFFCLFVFSAINERVIHITSAVHHVCYNNNRGAGSMNWAWVNDINVIKEEQICECVEKYAAFTTYLIKLFQSTTTSTATDNNIFSIRKNK